MSALAGWRVALRVGRRDALRARGRSLLVLAMIALPVLAVTTATVAQRTTDVSAVEGLDRSLGSAAARVSVDTASRMSLAQDADAVVVATLGDQELTGPAPDAESLAALLSAPVTEVVDIGFQVQSDDGLAPAEGIEADLADPLTQGLVELVSGRLPDDAGEVVVNAAMLAQGYAVGDRLLTAGASDGPTIVGVAESTSVRDLPYAAGPVGSLPVTGEPTLRSYLVGGGPVGWATVQELNALGASVLSRAVVHDPPSDAELAPEVRQRSIGPDATAVTVVALVVSMALLEVVLLAGPAFAVGARRLQRTLALMMAAGATPRQARRVVLAGAVVLGTAAAVLGVGAGVLLALPVLAVLQRYSDSYFGPFDVPVLPLLTVALFGLASAVLAAVVPAFLASRQDVVAVLAGRRGDPRPTYRSPLLGVVLLGLGVATSAAGSRVGSSELLIAVGALVSVLGMVLVVPVVVTGVARLARRLPLSLRFAARDAARHRTRTAPAVAAVAASVAGVVALLVANTSDGAENEATYVPSYARGVGAVTASSATDVDPAAVAAVVEREVPGATLTPVLGVTTPPPGAAEEFSYTSVVRAGATPGDGTYVPPLDISTTGAFGSDLLVSDDGLPPGITGVSDADRAAAREALAAGQVVAFTSEDAGAAPTTGESLVLRTESSDGTGVAIDVSERPVTATVLHVRNAPASAVLPSAVAQSLGQPVTQTALLVTGVTISQDEEDAVAEGVQALAVVQEAGFSYSPYSFSVERGYEGDQETLVLQLILVGLGGVLMLGGTLTATFLALSDARPDLATLAAVGASPRRRRAIAASYALVVGLTGAVLGAAVGFVPGLAVAVPLTSSGASYVVAGSGAVSGEPAPVGPFIDVPWLMILGLVVALPLLTAAVVAAATRSRLPLVTRLD